MTYGATPKAVSKRKGSMVVKDSSPGTSCHSSNDGTKVIIGNPRCLAIFDKRAKTRVSAVTCDPLHKGVGS